MTGYAAGLEAPFWLVAGSLVISALMVWLQAEETLPRPNPAFAWDSPRKLMKPRALFFALVFATSLTATADAKQRASKPAGH